jgi:uncharacterized lipoprotein YmbA
VEKLLIMNKLNSYLLVGSSLFLLLCGGCLMPESTHVEPDYFLLSDFYLEQNDSTFKRDCSFYLREIELPRYLKDPRMIFRPSEHTITFRESKRWGEPLEDGLSRVLSLNLHSLLNFTNYSIFPNRRKEGLLWDLSISFSAFEKVDGRVLIDSKWFAKDKKNSSLSGSFEHEIILPNDADEFEEIEAFNKALAYLAKNIADQLIFQ